MTRCPIAPEIDMAALLKYRGDRERRVVLAGDLAWWRCNEEGIVTESSGPGLVRVDRDDGELVGRNIWTEWPEYLGQPPYVQVQEVLDGKKTRDECLYWVKVNGYAPDLWWCRVAYDPHFLPDGRVERGVLVVTHRIPAQLPKVPAAWGEQDAIADGRSSP